SRASSISSFSRPFCSLRSFRKPARASANAISSASPELQAAGAVYATISCQKGAPLPGMELRRISLEPTERAKGHAKAKNPIFLWYDKDAEAAARFYAETFPDSAVGAIHRAPGDYPSGKAGDVLTVAFTVAGVSCVGLNGGPAFKHSEA